MHSKVTSLFVGNLHALVTPNELYETFSAYGGVASVYISRNKRTKMSRGFGYVNFYLEKDAANAIKELNCTWYRGGLLTVMYKKDNKIDRYNKEATVIVQNLHPDMNDYDLVDVFSDFGTLTRCKVITNKHGKSMRYGFVTFEDVKDADKVIYHSIENLDGSKIYTTRLKSKKERKEELDNSYTKLFVKLYYNYCTQEKLEEIFQKYGKVESVKLGRSKLDAIIKFSTHESAKMAVTELNHKSFFDLKLKLLVSRVKSKSEIREERQKSVLYLTNILQMATDFDLIMRFPELRKVKQIKMYTSMNESSKNYAFVHFHSAKQAARALNAMNNRSFLGVVMSACYANQKAKNS